MDQSPLSFHQPQKGMCVSQRPLAWNPRQDAESGRSLGAERGAWLTFRGRLAPQEAGVSVTVFL